MCRKREGVDSRWQLAKRTGPGPSGALDMLWTEYLCHSKTHMLKLNSQCDEIRRWFLREVIGSWGWGLCPCCEVGRDAMGWVPWLGGLLAGLNRALGGLPDWVGLLTVFYSQVGSLVRLYSHLCLREVAGCVSQGGITGWTSWLSRATGWVLQHSCLGRVSGCAPGWMVPLAGLCL